MELQRLLAKADNQGVWAFTLATLSALLGGVEPSYHALALKRAADRGVLVRAARGVYVNPLARSLPSDPRSALVAFLRPREFSYLSLEARLSEAGVISQVATVLTCMTTGPSGEFDTPWGIVEFVHTDRPVTEQSGVEFSGNELPRASVERAWRDLKRVGRNVGLVDDATLRAAVASEAVT